MSDIVLIFMLGGTLIFIIVFVLLLKILAMISVFGWNKTKELLQSDDWEFGRRIPERLEKEFDNNGSK